MQSAPPSARLMGMINGYLVSQALHAAAVLGIADHLEDGITDIDGLARATGTQAGPLYRLLRALAAAGVFAELPERHFALTDLGACLRSRAPEPLGAWAVHIGQPYIWAASGALLHSIRTGEPGFRHVHGMDPWAYRADRPDMAAMFDRAMGDLARRSAAGVVAAYDFGEFRRIVDIGGGRGMLLAMILAANPESRGVLFDQPHVVATAPALLREAGVLDRCECQGGDFFRAVPASGDAYILKSVLHDWPTAKAVAILRACRAAMGPTGRLLAIERVIGASDDLGTASFSDINMLVMLGAQERTEEEFAALYDAAGFALVRVVPAALGYCVIEGVPR